MPESEAVMVRVSGWWGDLRWFARDVKNFYWLERRDGAGPLIAVCKAVRLAWALPF